MGQIISSTAFYLYGRKNFTATGYLKHAATYPTGTVQDSSTIKLNQPGADGVDLTNKVVVITGANSGIGKELATYAAAKGGRVYMFCRSKDRAEKAKEEIMKATSSETVEIILVDLVSLINPFFYDETVLFFFLLSFVQLLTKFLRSIFLLLRIIE